MAEQVTVIIEAVDKLSDVVANISDNFRVATENIQNNVNQLTQQFERLRNFGLALAGIGAALSASFAVVAKAGGDYAEKVNEAAKRTGMAVDQMALLRSALSDLEVNAEALDELMMRLVLAMREAREAMQAGKVNDYAAAFQRLGVVVTDTSGQLKNVEQIFTEVLLKLAEMPNESERAAIAMQLFGRSAINLVPALNAGKQAILETLQAHKAAGVALKADVVKAIDDMRDSIGTLQTALQALAARITAGFAPAVKDAADKMTELVGKVNEFLDRYPKLRDALGTIALFGTYLATATGSAIAFLSQVAIIAAHWGALTGALSRISGFLRLGSILTALGTVAKWVTGAVAALAAALGIPVWLAWLLVAAIAAVVAALIVFRDKIWAFIKSAGVAIWNFLKDLWATVKEIPSVIWEMVSQAVAAVWEFAKKLWERIKELPSRLWESIKNAVRAAYEWGKNIVVALAKGIWDYITYPVRAFMDLLKRLREMLPFSDPKVGPLRDLTRATRKIGEAVAASLNIKVVMPQIVGASLAAGGVSVRPVGTYAYTIHILAEKQVKGMIDKALSEFIDALRLHALGR